MRASRMFLTFAFLCTAPQASAQALSAEQAHFREIYRELVEIDTTHSAGDTTRAAHAMQERLRNAGFAEEDLLVLEPFPRKGNLVVRLRGHGKSAPLPLLLLAHIDVVEARKEDWNSDPFELQERDGYFTARGSLDDKAMAAAFVSTLGQLKRESFAPRRDIVLALTADEERGDVPSIAERHPTVRAGILARIWLCVVSPRMPEGEPWRNGARHPHPGLPPQAGEGATQASTVTRARRYRD